MVGENLDLTSGDDQTRQRAGRRQRPFVGIRFACCDVYTRVYIAADGQAYRGACPRCGRKVELLIGPGGTDARFFTAG